MKGINKYNELKKQYSDFVILIKSGAFYLTYNFDSLILNYLFNYQIKDSKLGFPTSGLDKVTNSLKSEKISYIIFNTEDNIIENISDNNKYYSFLEIAQKYNYDQTSLNFLLERIKIVIKKDKDNYLKIKDFIDEL